MNTQLLACFVLAMSTVVGLAQNHPAVSTNLAAEAQFSKEMKDPKSRKQSLFIVQMALGEMGYGTGPFHGEFDETTRRAIASFRTKAGISDTTEPFNFATYESILSTWGELRKPDMLMGGLTVSTDSWDSWVGAKGTWIIEGQEQGIPIQTSEIECRHDLGKCVEAIAMIQDNDYLAVWLEFHEIERWDNVEITTKRDLGCVRYTMRFSRSQKTVTGLRAKISGDDMCRGINDSDSRLKLVSGLEAVKTYNAKREQHARKFLNADFTVLDDIRQRP